MSTTNSTSTSLSAACRASSARSQVASRIRRTARCCLACGLSSVIRRDYRLRRDAVLRVPVPARARAARGCRSQRGARRAPTHARGAARVRSRSSRVRTRARRRHDHGRGHGTAAGGRTVRRIDEYAVEAVYHALFAAPIPAILGVIGFRVRGGVGALLIASALVLFVVMFFLSYALFCIGCT